jgi:signal transduction histidine kinase/DNA-binding response OmpR family regulator
VPLNADPGERAGNDDERASILIVDDLDEKLLVFTTVLEHPSYQLVCARSGAEALRHVLKTEFAAILLDVNMPDIDGFETATLIRQYKRSAQTPIIFVTAYADEMQTLRGYSLGAVDYILSPIVPDVLRSKVKVFVDLHLAQRRLRRRVDERVALAAAEAARSVAEENTKRSNFLSRASQRLSASLDPEAAARQLLELLVPELGARASVALCDESGAPVVVFDCEVSEGGARRLGQRMASDLSEREAQSWRRTLAGVADPGTGAADPLRLPLVTARRAVGALVLWTAGGVDDLVRELAGRSAVALENAGLYRSLQVEIDERRDIEARLQTSNRRKDEFLAMLSHELRNPLAPIRTALEVIRQVAPSEPKLSWAMDVTRRQINQLTRLVEDLLDVARINQGKITLQAEALDLRAVVEHAVETVLPFAKTRRHQLNKTVPDAPVMMRGDFARLSQVIANLLNNAAKYTEDSGAIDIALVVTPASRAEITVTDNGIGIDAELLPNVFELFEQGKRSLDRSQGGLGVGLTLVQRLVEMHHGTVEATSAGVGLGSQFRVTLPCLAGVQERPSAATAASGPPITRHACRILVVDDNQDAADSTAVLLQLAGHEVKAVSDGHDALASAPVFAPNVVLLDIGLPGLDGYAVARQLRAMAETRSSCLIALTGYGQPTDRERASEAGFDHHLTKPADPDALLRVIQDSLQAAHPASTGEAAPAASARGQLS